jgi:hypothetical protein
MSNSFAGIAPESALGFMAAEVAGLVLAAVIFRFVQKHQ